MTDLSKPNGPPMTKPSRFDRRTSKAKKKQEEDAEIEQATKPKRKSIGSRLRAMVMERDGYKCVKCGTKGTPENDLQIGHKVPVCQGGTNDEDNLRTECRACNVGSGGRRSVADSPPPKPEVSEEDRRLLAEKEKQIKPVIRAGEIRKQKEVK